jgi:DNA replication protein DnaC
VQHDDLDDAMEPYIHPHVLVIHELGYQSYASDAANVLFRVVSLRHLKRRPIVVTTNKPLAALAQVLHMATWPRRYLTGLLERGTHYILRGRSCRTRHPKTDTSTAAENAA